MCHHHGERAGPRESRHTASLLSSNHFCLRMFLVANFPVAISEGSHPFPSRTRKLSPPEPMVLRGKPRGRVGRCRIFLLRAPGALHWAPGAFFLARCLMARPGRRGLGRPGPGNASNPLDSLCNSGVHCCLTGRPCSSRVPGFRPAFFRLDGPCCCPG